MTYQEYEEQYPTEAELVFSIYNLIEKGYPEKAFQALLVYRDAVAGKGWISVKDAMPPANTLVLCVGAKGGMFLGMSYSNSSITESPVFMLVPNSRSGRYAVYWMPLPEAPKEKI